MKRMMLIALALLGVSATLPSGEAAFYPPCDTYCPGKTSSTVCGCPVWTDRDYAKVTCGSWNRVGGCWYE
jgi:hypothetical protein